MPDLPLLDYALPPELVAQHPAPGREDARLLVAERASGALHDRAIPDLLSWLRAGDVLVLNETRVLPARLVTRREPTGGRVELLFVRPAAAPPGAGPDAGAGSERWVALARPARNARSGTRLASEGGSLELEVVAAHPGGERELRVVRGTLREALEAEGRVPLPPYIEREPEAADRERYQTVFARVEGAVAAPTAGLHFTPALLARAEAAGIGLVRLVLHVGPGTFRPLSSDDPREHRMDAEWFALGEEAAATLVAARARGGRIVAVGTTSVRALESACDANGGAIGPASGWTTKYILPPYAFRAVDALLTNFHLPRTTLLLLVAAFAGEELTRRAYAHAVAARYRFYSYGDAMLVV